MVVLAFSSTSFCEREQELGHRLDGGVLCEKLRGTVAPRLHSVNKNWVIAGLIFYFGCVRKVKLRQGQVCNCMFAFAPDGRCSSWVSCGGNSPATSRFLCASVSVSEGIEAVSQSGGVLS